MYVEGLSEGARLEVGDSHRSAPSDCASFVWVVDMKAQGGNWGRLKGVDFGEERVPLFCLPIKARKEETSRRQTISVRVLRNEGARLEGGDLGQERILLLRLLRGGCPLEGLGVCGAAVALAAPRQAPLRALQQRHTELLLIIT